MKIEEIKIKYKPITDDIIKSNSCFNQFLDNVEWEYKIYDNCQIIASSSKDGSLKINPLAIIEIERRNEPLMLEYFIMHEVRHSYQRRFIQQNIDKQHPLAIQWLYEFNNSINPTFDLSGYYSKLTELDAFAFSYAVIKYKYGDISYIKPAKFYETNDMYNHYVSEYILHFKNNSL